MPLNTLILFVTSRCNARCRTCFYWEELNGKDDLSLDEILRLSRTMPSFQELWLSGGEPLMRKGLDEIVAHFYNHNGVRTLNLPTNGLFGKRTADLLEFASRELPALDVNLNVALDGFQETHDRIRGVPGNFDKAVALLSDLLPIRDRNPNIHLHVNSVVTSENCGELEELGWWLVENADLNGHYFQVIRGDPLDPELKRLSPAQVRRLYQGVKPIHEFYGNKLARRHGGGVRGWLKNLYYTQTLLLHYTIQEKNLRHSSPWPVACSAGDSILVIDANGDLRACELRERISNLRQVDCDFRRLYPTQRMRDERRQIVDDQCWCTHVCFIHDSLKQSSRARYYDIPLAAKVV